MLTVLPHFQVTISSCFEASVGNDLKPVQVKDAPTLSWPTEPEALNTVVMTGPGK